MVVQKGRLLKDFKVRARFLLNGVLIFLRGAFAAMICGETRIYSLDSMTKWKKDLRLIKGIGCNFCPFGSLPAIIPILQSSPMKSGSWYQRNPDYGGQIWKIRK